MNARQFLDENDDAEVERVAIAAGTNLAYFKQLARGLRYPSRLLAGRLIEASDGRLTQTELMPTKPAKRKVDPAGSDAHR